MWIPSHDKYIGKWTAPEGEEQVWRAGNKKGDAIASSCAFKKWEEEDCWRTTRDRAQRRAVLMANRMAKGGLAFSREGFESG